MTAKKNTGPVQLGEVMGDLLAQAQARAALPPPKRQTKKITPTGLILTEADQKLIKEAAKEATTLQRNLMAEADEKLLAEYKKLPTLQINVADQTPFKAATRL